MKAQLCHYPGCDVISLNYYCTKHKVIADKKRTEREAEQKKKLFQGTQRKSSNPYHHLYNSRRWKNIRREFLKLHNTCVICGNYADTVDHILAHKGNEEQFYNMNNLQAMCHSCHSKKTMKEK